MRIIAGSARGRKINSPKGKVRPLRGQVREALFNILSFPEEREFLDLFAGTGAVGLEALSRGFSKSTFVELSSQNCSLITRNVKDLGFEMERARIIKKNVFYFLNALQERPAKFDVIFAGTPYIDEVLIKLFARSGELISCLNDDGVLIIQSPSDSKIEIPDNFQMRKYGGDTLWFFYK